MFMDDNGEKYGYNEKNGGLFWRDENFIKIIWEIFFVYFYSFKSIT